MKISIAECAEILEGSPGWVRSLCDRQIIGDSYGTGTHRKTYKIVQSKLARFMQIPEHELMQRVIEVRESEVL